ncbi:MAG TPA: zinc-dependent alcohol dehydrogenase family protein [Gammaproteobacteria bacterium]|jgi:NADPH2:quinone reductase|nr:zinc-dependent alcohol dehydrogenase family protein [Gammaproteobacteria bacterium]
MRAMVISRFGGPEVFAVRDVGQPRCGASEVLVRVVCSGTNPVEAKLRQDGSWAGLTPPLVLGYDVSGVVEAVGEDVSEFKPGDQVYYTPEIFGNLLGSYAEYNVAPARIIAPKPRNLSHEQAAAVPLAGGTAWEAIVRRLRVRPGETVLIHGGAGGVGSFAVQIAKAAGARVLASAGTGNQDVLRQLGADVAIDYSKEDPIDAALRATEQAGVDAVFSTVAGTAIGDSISAAKPFGRLATVLAPGGDLSGLYPKNLTLYGIFLTRESERLHEMTRLIEQGGMQPLVERVLPLEQVRQAHERLDSGHGTGKIVLRVSEG